MNFKEKLFIIYDNIKDSDLLSDYYIKFPNYFSSEQRELNNKDVEKFDNCLYRDYLRIDRNREIKLNDISNPFEESRYAINNLEKTYYIYKDDNYEGPYNNYAMDLFIKDKVLTKDSIISLNKIENITLIDFLKITYPLLKEKPENNKDKDKKYSLNTKNNLIIKKSEREIYKKVKTTNENIINITSNPEQYKKQYTSQKYIMHNLNESNKNTDITKDKKHSYLTNLPESSKHITLIEEETNSIDFDNKITNKRKNTKSHFTNKGDNN